MKVKSFTDTRTFFDIYYDRLLARESINAILLGIADKHPTAHYVSIEYKDKVLLAMIPPSKSIILSGHFSFEMLQALADYFQVNFIKPIRVFAENELSDLFNKIWIQVSSTLFEIEFNEMLYRLDELNMIELSDTGSLVFANVNHVSLVTKWIRDFTKEAHEEKTEEEARCAAELKIGRNEIYLWIEGGIPVSMVASTRPTPNTVSINHVYTPKVFRGNSYATNCVYNLTNLLLEEYKYCLLFTDLSNPTSNGIYKKIGYKPIKAFRQYKYID